MPKYDSIVIGSGPNGLSAAIELAKNGQKVLVVEGSDSVGGGTRTSELTLPGFKHDYCSAVHTLGVLSPYLKSLPLQDFGLKWCYPEASVAHPMDGEPSLLLKKSVVDTAAQFGKDEASWIKVFDYLRQNGIELLEDALGPLGFPKNPLLFARFGLKALLPASTFCNLHFKDKRAKALFAGCAAHSILPLDYFFTAALGLIFGVAGHLENWPVVAGGSHNLTKSMASYFESLGGEIKLSHWVNDLNTLPDAKAYVFDTDPIQLGRIAGSALSESYKKRLGKYNHGPGCFKIDWALDGPIPWKDKNTLKASTVHIGGTLEEIAMSERLAWEGKHSDQPFVLLCQQSMFDESRAPDGKHTGYAYCHVPNGSKKDMTLEIENQIERFAPGFRDIILDRKTISTQQFQAYNPNYLGGAVTGGAADVTQLFTRPVARWNPYTTPNPRIYICSASTPPGGGVHGMCGYWAARAVIKGWKRLG